MTPVQFLYLGLCHVDPSAGTGCDTPWHGDAGHGDEQGRCRTPGKTPVSGWRQLERWSARKPDGNAAVRCGPETGLLVIDVDTPEGAAAYAAWGLPSTYTVRSGRVEEAHHYYFRWPEGLDRVPNRLDGVEVKGPGRYVVAPGSVHKSGRTYDKVSQAAIATLPEAFVERLRAGTAQHRLSGTSDATPEAQERLELWLQMFPEAEEQRDGNWQMICPAHNDHDPSLVVIASEDKLLLNCRAGCSAQEIAEAQDWTLSDLRGRLAPATFDPLSDVTWRRVVPGAESLGTDFLLRDLMSCDIAPTRWIVPGIVPDGLTLLAGPPKLGKSWLVLDLAIQVAGGGTFLATDVDAGDVLYMALEDSPRRLQGRARTLLAGQPAPWQLRLRTRAGKLSSGLIPEIEDWIDAQPDPRLVIIDTLGRVQDNGTLDSKDGGYADAVEALAGLQDIAATRGVAVVVITHTKKGGWSAGSDPLEAVLGSQGYAGTADSILVLKRERGEPLGELFVTGREIDTEMRRKIRFDDVQCRWLVGHEMTLEQEIMKAVSEQPFKLTGQGVRNAVGRNEQETYGVLAALEAAGKLIKAKPEGGGWERWGLPV